MASFYLNLILYFVMFLTLATVSSGGNELSKLLRKKRETNSSGFSDLIKAIVNEDAVGFQNYYDKLKLDLAPLLKDVKNELDEYPGDVNKTFSNVKQVDGNSIETNKTIIKQTKNNMVVGVIKKTQSVNGKPQMQAIISYSGTNDNGNQDTNTTTTTTTSTK